MALVMEPATPWLRDLSRYLSGAGAGAFVPPADVLVNDEEVIVHMDIPGVAPDQLEIELENDVLTVRGERSFPYAQEKGDGRTWQRIERAFGRFERDLRVPKGLDPDAIQASLANGVLTLRIPKPEPIKPRRIQVQTADAGERKLEGAGAGR
jgi:HSP20 family protein